MRFGLFYGCIFIVFVMYGCHPIGRYPSSYVYSNFIIKEPTKFDCYLNKAGTGRKINLSINLVTQYATGSSNNPNFIHLTDQTLTFNSATDTWPVTISGQIPTDGTAWECIVTITGLECSTCASGYGDQQEATGSCYDNVIVPISTPAQYQAAKPRWQGGLHEILSQTNYTITPGRIPNLPKSCTCSTP